MRPRLILALAVQVLTPLVSLAWLGARFAADARVEVEARFTEVIEARLAEQAATVGRLMAEKSRALLEATTDFPEDPSEIRDRVRAEARYRFVLVLDVEGRRAFPPADAPVSEAERAFVERTRGLWQGRALSGRTAPPPVSRSASQRRQGLIPPPGKMQRAAPPEDVGSVVPLSTVAGQGEDAHGWHIWYWGGGLNLMFWRRQPDGRLVAVEVDRVQLLADVVARLPETSGGAAEERTTLLDSSGQLIYQWGAWVPPPGLEPRLFHALPAPLTAWRLAWTGPAPVAEGMNLGLLAGLIAIGLALAGLAVWFYRESTRALRQASRRVTFVNQVSHELKTPLTNIRMYAELLEDELVDEDDRVARYVGVIVGESQRLSRLIGNILTFARRQKETLRLRPAEGVVDAVVEAVVEQFRPSLERRGIAVRLELDAERTVRLDADALGQILGNLLSNVEKYAEGGPVRISTHQEGDHSLVTVHDSGPGIGRGDRARVFEPFARLSDALTEGVAGTGIGLGIARDLARLHGGDLRLLPSDEGARFEVRLDHTQGG